MKKIISKDELDELMVVAKQPLKVPLRKKRNGDTRNTAHSVEQVRKYLEDEGLNRGITKLPVPAELIYNRYLQWCKNNFEIACPYLTFFKKFRLFFNMKKVGGQTNYLINPDGFDLSEQNKQFVSHEINKKIKNQTKKP